MTGIAYAIDAPDLAEALTRLGALAHVVTEHGTDLTELAKAVGENAAKRRIHDEKRAPDGEPWAGWSPEYGATRHLNQTILESQGHLLQSIAGLNDADSATVGSNLVYAAIHQLGGDTDQGHPPIPARPYLGLSPADRDELREDITTFLEQLL